MLSQRSRFFRIDVTKDLTKQLEAAFQDAADDQVFGPGLFVSTSSYCPNWKSWAVGCRSMTRSDLDGRKYVIRAHNNGCKDLFDIYFLDQIFDSVGFKFVRVTGDLPDTIDQVPSFFKVSN